MDPSKNKDASAGSGKKATRKSKSKRKSSTTSGPENRSLFTPVASTSRASGDQTVSNYICKTDGGSKRSSGSEKKTVDVGAEYGQSGSPESNPNFIINKTRYKYVFEKVKLSPPSSPASDDQSDSEVSNTETDVTCNIPDSTNNVVQDSACAGTSAAWESENKPSTSKGKQKSTRGGKSRSTSVPSYSRDSSDSSDHDWVSKTKSDVVASNNPDSKNKVVQDSACAGTSATRERTKHKMPTPEKKSRSTYVPNYSSSSSDSSDSEWVCKTNPDDEPSNIPDSKNKIVIAKASKGKGPARESKNKVTTTKDQEKSTHGKSRSASAPSCSLASSDPSGSGCKTGPVERQSRERKKKDAKAGPANVPRKWNSRLSPTRHKYKSVLKKRKRPNVNFAALKLAAGFDSNLQVSPFIDLTYWKMTSVCCGIVFFGRNNEVMVDTKFYKPCKACLEKKANVKETPQSTQSLDTNIDASISSPNEEETNLNSASNPNITDTDCKEMDK